MVMADNVKSFERHLRVSLALFLVVLLVGSSSSGANAEQATSRVYVSAYPCTIVHDGKTVNSTGTPSVALYDQNHYGETNYSGFTPTVVVNKTSTGESGSTLTCCLGIIVPSSKFSNVPLLFFRDGPLYRASRARAAPSRWRMRPSGLA